MSWIACSIVGFLTSTFCSFFVPNGLSARGSVLENIRVFVFLCNFTLKFVFPELSRRSLSVMFAPMSVLYIELNFSLAPNS